MADDVEFVGDAIAAVHVAGLAGDVQRLAAIIALDQGYGFDAERACVHEAACLQRGVQSQRDFGLHVG